MNPLDALDALVRLRAWELDEATAKVRAIEDRQRALGQDEDRVADRRSNLLASGPRLQDACGIDRHRRTLRLLAELGSQSERLACQKGLLEQELAEAGRDCVRLSARLEAIRDHRERLAAAVHADGLRRSAREADAAHLVLLAAGRAGT